LTFKSSSRRIKIGAPTPTFKVLNITVMISPNLVFVQLAQYDDYICIRELAKILETSVPVVRHKLKDLGDRVEHNEKDEWRVVKEIVVNDDRSLSEAEKAERNNLERTVQQAFFIAGKALKQLRDKRLYRETHATFESYVRDRFDFTRAAAYYLISAAEVVENLKCQQIVDTNKNTNILPTRESQCRSLAKLAPQLQPLAWCRAVELAGNKVPSSRLVKEAVKEIGKIDAPASPEGEIQPDFREVNYQAGMGVEYTVRLSEETYNRLQKYQDKISSATKDGAIARLLDGVIE
jgi:hypothetical protein